MTLTACTICGRVLRSTESVCACGASITWLDRAPAMLRAKLGRAARQTIGAATVSALVGCSTLCAALDGGDRDTATADGGVTP